MSTKTQSDRVWETLRSDIIASRVLPGSKLRINDIAETSEVSLGAVREALSRLSAEGLVIAELQKGYRVAPLSAEELLDITDARVEIERIALSRSIARGDLEWETNLVAAWHRLSRTPERVPEDVRLVSDRVGRRSRGFSSGAGQRMRISETPSDSGPALRAVGTLSPVFRPSRQYQTRRRGGASEDFRRRRRARRRRRDERDLGSPAQDGGDPCDHSGCSKRRSQSRSGD